MGPQFENVWLKSFFQVVRVLLLILVTLLLTTSVVNIILPTADNSYNKGFEHVLSPFLSQYILELKLIRKRWENVICTYKRNTTLIEQSAKVLNPGYCFFEQRPIR